MIQNRIFVIPFVKILFQAINFFILAHTLQSVFVPDLLEKVSKLTKTCRKDYSFCDTVLLQKPHSHYEPQLTSH